MKKIDDINYEHDQQVKESLTPSNAFVSMLKTALAEHPDIIKDTVEDIIRKIAEDVADKAIGNHYQCVHSNSWHTLR